MAGKNECKRCVMFMEKKDQAETLRRKMEIEQDLEGIMASHLPPRSVVHKNKKRKNRRKRTKPRYIIIRLLMIVFLLLPIIIGIYYYTREIKFNEIHKQLEHNRENPHYDHVEFE